MGIIKKYVEEVKLYSQKWFDYRPVCPEGCDMLFVAEWLKVHSWHEERYKLCVDLDERGREVLPHPWSGLPEMRYDPTFTAQMRQLRFSCDRKGWKYDHWWSFAYRVLMGNKVKDFAGIFAELATPSFKGSVADLYTDYRKEFIEFSSAINAETYTGAKWQRDYFTYIKRETQHRYPQRWKELLLKMKQSGVYVEIN